MNCSSAEGRMNFCVLFTSCTLSLSGIHCRTDIDRQFAGIPDLLIAETGLQEISGGISLELTLTSGGSTATQEHEITPTALSGMYLGGSFALGAAEVGAQLQYQFAFFLPQGEPVSGSPSA